MARPRRARWTRTSSRSGWPKLIACERGSVRGTMPRFEFREGSSNKFWEIELTGKSFTTRYGKIGAEGQTRTTRFASPAQAKQAYNKLVASKLRKGYAPPGGAAP